MIMKTHHPTAYLEVNFIISGAYYSPREFHPLSKAVNMQSIRSAEGVFIRLVRDVLNSKKPAALPEGVTAEDIYIIGHRQKMVTLTLFGLNSISPRPPGNSWEKYMRVFSAACLNNEIQMAECRSIIDYLCRNGVKIIPLKGCEINEIYPSPGLRSMTDIDLLYEGVGTKELSRLMAACGYTAGRLDDGHHHHSFHKGSFLTVELHRSPVENNSFRPVCEGLFPKAVPDNRIKNLFHLKPEDFYIHIIVHAANHFMKGGLGVRPYCDIYLLNQKYGDTWDEEYLARQFRSVGLEKFEAKVRDLAYAFFGVEGKEVQGDDWEFSFRSGLYGGDYSWSYKASGGTSRIGFILKCAFLSVSDFREKYPVLKKYPVFLPVVWFDRMTNQVFHRFKSNLSLLKTITKEESANAGKIKERYGL